MKRSRKKLLIVALLCLLPLGLFLWAREVRSWQPRVVMEEPTWNSSAPPPTSPLVFFGGAVIAPDGQEFAINVTTHLTRGAIVIVNSRNFAETARFDLTEPISAFAYSPDMSLLAAMNENSQWVWDRHNKKLLRKKQWPDIRGITFDKQHHLALGDVDGTVRIWDLKTDQVSHFKVSCAVINNLAFSPDGRLLAVMTGGDFNLPRTGDKTKVDNDRVYLWDCVAKRSMGLLGGPNEVISSFAFSHQPGRIATCSKTNRENETVKFWDVHTQKLVAHWAVELPLDGLTFTPDDKTLIGVCYDADAIELGDGSHNNIQMYSVADGSLQRVISAIPNSFELFPDLNNLLDSFSLSPDGNNLLTIVGQKVQLWRAK